MFRLSTTSALNLIIVLKYLCHAGFKLSEQAIDINFAKGSASLEVFWVDSLVATNFPILQCFSQPLLFIIFFVETGISGQNKNETRKTPKEVDGL